MTGSTILYSIMFVVIIYFIYSNIKSSIQYKKQNMEIFLQLNNDDKKMRFVSSLVVALLMGFTGVLLFGMISTKTFIAENVMVMVLLPAAMVVLYVPLSKKTRISTLGIHKRSYLVRWEDIKSINYLKPNEKDIVKTKIIYTALSKDTTAEITFLKNDPQLEQFKEIAKTYNKKKDKKDKQSGK